MANLDVSSDDSKTLSDLVADQAFLIINPTTNRASILAKDSAGDSISTFLRASKRYVANLTQSSTSAPVATELENDLGAAVVFARTSAGLFTATLTGAFTVGKTTVKFGTSIAVNSMGAIQAVLTSANVITFTTLDYKTSDDTSAPLDGMLTNTVIEIEVFP